jgi:hypothetical protein
MVYQQVWDIRYAQTKPTSIHSFEPCLEYFLRRALVGKTINIKYYKK